MPETALPEPTFDRDGYPTEETLERLATWPLKSGEDFAAALDFLADAWDRHYGSVQHELEPALAKVVSPHGIFDGHRFLRLATGGWSANESLIGAIGQNLMLWSVTWRLSTAGGLHVFTYPMGTRS